jgi:pilus assembly protein FimV
VQSGASGAGTGTELRAELTQAREDLAARQSEVAELRSQLTELDEQQADSERLVALQDSQLKALQDRLGQPEPVAAAPAPAPAPEPTAAPAETAAEAPVAGPAPWYMNPLVLVGTGLVLLGGLVLALRGRRSKSPMPVPSRRISDDDAVRASLPGAQRAAAEPASDDAAADAEAAAAEAGVDENLLRLQNALRERPGDLEAHIGLLRYHYARGEAAQYESAAAAMRIQVRSTLDPRWREAVVMGASLAPGNALFSQAGWNAPRFGDTGVMPATAKPAEPAPEPVPDLDDLDAITLSPTPSSAPVDQDEDWERITSGGAGIRLTAPEPAPEPEPEPDFSAVPEQDFDAGFDAAPAVADEGDDGSATKIELAKAYLDIGDVEGAKGMLEEVLAEAGPAGRAEAARLLKDIG